MIRPLIYTYEKDIIAFASKENLPVYKAPCPADGKTERTGVNDFLAGMEKHSPGLRYRIFGAIQRGNIDGFHPVDLAPHKHRRLPADRDGEGEEE